jgi:hypothetical protein
MANGHGGARQGTPGKGYSNRTDLLTDRSPAAGASSAASGGRPVEAAPFITPDQVPSPTAPTAYPDEPLTTGLNAGPGAGPESLPINTALPNNEVVQRLRALLLSDPTNPDLRRLLSRAQIGTR